MLSLSTTILAQASQSNNGNKSEAEIEQNIKAIQRKLKTLKKELNKAYGQEQVLLEKLEQQDIVISDLSNKIQATDLIIKNLIQQISELTNAISKNTNSIENQKTEIINLLKLQIYLNHDRTLKMLLVSPKNNKTSQTKHQVKYLQNRLYNLIKEVASKIIQLEKLKSEQVALQEKESQIKKGLVTQKNELFEQRNTRLKTLNKLKIEIAKHESESDGLNKDQKRLQQLLNEIQVLLSDLPKNLGSKPFALLKGKMKKPTKGKYIRSFHSTRSETTRWNGVVIQSELGSSVQAIAYGRVAFADWLRGFGMLVIIDHQDGYMSLYGFNESLTVDVGDWVDARQAIATIGNSGTLATPAVYFEIRKNAKPLNPKVWVK